MPRPGGQVSKAVRSGGPPKAVPSVISRDAIGRPGARIGSGIRPKPVRSVSDAFGGQGVRVHHLDQGGLAKMY
ncbi:hypothetical protein MCC01964_19020 [Bifidobacteriaceae bacterium MCC01964]|nr:hypothetical protein MCC01964_19020 [Bifidobacteriaceae bacterium MCC01964]